MTNFVFPKKGYVVSPEQRESGTPLSQPAMTRFAGLGSSSCYCVTTWWACRRTRHDVLRCPARLDFLHKPVQPQHVLTHSDLASVADGESVPLPTASTLLWQIRLYLRYCKTRLFCSYVPDGNLVFSDYFLIHVPCTLPELDSLFNIWCNCSWYARILLDSNAFAYVPPFGVVHFLLLLSLS